MQFTIVSTQPENENASDVFSALTQSIVVILFPFCISTGYNGWIIMDEVILGKDQDFGPKMILAVCYSLLVCLQVNCTHCEVDVFSSRPNNPERI